ncbi:hypothetical protein B0H19DRAFT_1074289 [Mycena capillaripes]|nr:hypothetical protein B0H19DRAFT_1074289 [Mycena capillaripes]
MLPARETGGAKRSRSRGADLSRSPRTPTGRSREGDTDARLVSSSPRRAGGWMESAPKEGGGGGGGDGGVIGSGNGNGNGNAAAQTSTPQPLSQSAVNDPLPQLRIRRSALSTANGVYSLHCFTPLEIAITVIFSSTRDVSRAPLPRGSVPTSCHSYEHRASETAADGDPLAGLMGGAVSDQAPDAACSPNWGPSWCAMARASMRWVRVRVMREVYERRRECSGGAWVDSPTAGVSGDEGSGGLDLGSIDFTRTVLILFVVVGSSYYADFLVPGNLYGSKSENYYPEPASNRSDGT